MASFKMLNGLEIDEENEQRQKEFDQKCYIKDNCIIFNFGAEYPIELRRCATAEAILGWIDHLCCTKAWITTDIIKKFIDLATIHHKIQIHPLP